MTMANAKPMVCEVIEVTELTNHYECDRCGTSWEDTWCASCDDDCPSCGATTSPHETDEGETHEIRKGLDSCPICDDVHEF